LFHKVCQTKPESKEELTMTTEAGTIVRIRNLQSAAGQKLNGRRAAVIGFVEAEQRWQVRVEMEEAYNATKALKEANLEAIRRLPLPQGPHRGMASPTDIESMPVKLCELLLYYKSNPRFEPSEIMFMGYGAMAFTRMGQENFMNFTTTQMEQMGGVLGLANICREGEEPGTEAVLFALLEGDPMYVDVLIQTLHWTGFIAPDGVEPEGRFDGPPTQLTPDQDLDPYVRTMSAGPVSLLSEMAKWCFAGALWSAMQRSEFYHLLIQRLLRLTAREALGTKDGRRLGKPARKILSSMFPVLQLDNPVARESAEHILAHAGDIITSPDNVSTESVSRILNGRTKP
jgi:hypothetical protein